METAPQPWGNRAETIVSERNFLILVRLLDAAARCSARRISRSASADRRKRFSPPTLRHHAETPATMIAYLVLADFRPSHHALARQFDGDPLHPSPRKAVVNELVWLKPV